MEENQTLSLRERPARGSRGQREGVGGRMGARPQDSVGSKVWPLSGAALGTKAGVLWPWAARKAITGYLGGSWRTHSEAGCLKCSWWQESCEILQVQVGSVLTPGGGFMSYFIKIKK